jgi:hypothetical protein
MREDAQISGDAEQQSARWHQWLAVLMALSAAFSGSLYLAVVVIDPMSTGRFALTQRIDYASRNPRLAKAGLVRDPQFDGALISSSSGFPLDPAKLAEGTRWRVAQLAIPAAIPVDQLVVTRAFARHHQGTPALMAFMVDNLWCRPGPPDEGRWGPFPAWLYEGSRLEYLSRIFFPSSLQTALARVGIWLGRGTQTERADGYAPEFPRQNRAALLSMQPPTGGVSPEAPFPAIRLMEDQLEALSADWPVVLVFAPVFAKALPEPGSAAAIRLQACKGRIERLAGQRRNTRYLDLMIDDPVVRVVDNFFDEEHYGPAVARWVESRISGLIRDSGLDGLAP